MVKDLGYLLVCNFNAKWECNENSHLVYVKRTILRLIESAIGQHLIANPECAKTYTDDNFRIIRKARSSFHLSVLESVYIKTQNSVLC